MRRLMCHAAVAAVTFAAGISAARLAGLIVSAPASETVTPPAARSAATDPNAEREVLELMRQYAPAQTRRDAAFFEKYEADTYTVTCLDGQILTKAQAIALMQSWDEDVTYEHEDLSVQLFGNGAVVTGWMKATYNGGEYPHVVRWRSIYLLGKRGGRWQVLSTTQVGG